MIMFLSNVRPLIAALCLGAGSICQGQSNHTIATPGSSFAFSVDGGPATNTTITMLAGSTNNLTISTASFHPVVIQNSQDTLPANRYANASPQNISSGVIKVIIPSTGFPTTLYYVCAVHGFSGQINITAPVLPPPPPNRILSINVGTNVVMTSTGTNTTWLFIPEFSSNLVGGLWAPVPNFNNTFANGTNRTTFNRLDPICGPN